MVVVKAKPGESPDSLIARFRKKVIRSGIIYEFKERERHKTQAERRKERKYRIERIKELEQKYGPREEWTK